MVNKVIPLGDFPQAQRLALVHAPRSARQWCLGLLALDARLAAILRKRREVVLAQVRLAWWRDLLADPTSDWPSGDPLLALLATWRDRSGLSLLVDGWEGLLADDLVPGAIDAFVAGRAAAWESAAAEMALADTAPARHCAEVWALADLAANLTDGGERAQAVERGLALAPCRRLPASLRTLAVLAALGRSSLLRGGEALVTGPKSALLALRVGTFGR